MIVLFAAGYLQFGLVECFHAPASERVNDGQHPTFFAYHIDPHGVMSEDFYLYVVRAKRILDRGWTDSPLNSRMETGRSYLAPVQALLGMIAVQTGGRPAPYSVYMACILLLGWGTLYFTAVCVLPERISTWAIVLAMMVAVLFESWRNLFGDPEFSAGIWPAERHLRMATMAWTSPWLLASIIVSVSLWFQPQGHGKRVLLLGVFLLVLGAADNWAFAIAWIAAGLSASGLGIAKLTNSRHAASWALLTGLVVVLGSSFGMQSFWAAEIRGDALLRSGFGADWLMPGNGIGLWRGLRKEWFIPCGLLSLLVALMPAIVVCVRSQQSPSWNPLNWRIYFRTDGRGRDWCAVIAGVAFAAAILVIALLSRRGIEGYLRNQIYWRINVLLLFAAVLALATSLKSVLGMLPAYRLPFARTSGVLTALLLTALFAYHQYRIHWFAANVVAKDYFITSDAEQLHDWLKSYDSVQSKPYQLATLSHELNFLCAYWTDADLLLPSGFPYHNLNTNQHIHRELVDLLRLYRANPLNWVNFNEPIRRPDRLSEYWRKSRTRAAGGSFLYLLYHRANHLHKHASPDWRELEILATANEIHREPMQSSLKPAVILVDQVSRTLGEPDLTGYTCQFRSKTIEAWVRDNTARARKESPQATALR